jgi:hypothetical protein
MRRLLLAGGVAALVGMAPAEEPPLAPGVPTAVEAMYPKDGKNTVLGQSDAGDAAYVLLENSDGESGVLLLYRYEKATGDASLVKASASLFPFDPNDSRTPPQGVQQALATLWAGHIVAVYDGGLPQLERFYRDNPDAWRGVSDEMKQAFLALGLKPSAPDN